MVVHKYAIQYMVIVGRCYVYICSNLLCESIFLSVNTFLLTCSCSLMLFTYGTGLKRKLVFCIVCSAAQISADHRYKSL